MTFATIEEAWGVTSLSSGPNLPPSVPADPTPKPTRNPYASPEVYRTEPSARERQHVRTFIDQTYDKHGIAGVLALLNRRILNDLRVQSFTNPAWMSLEQLLILFLGVFGIVVLLDFAK